MKLCDKILDLRKKQGLSQEQLAEQLNVSRQAVSRWESGAALPDAINVLQLSDLFGVTTDYLLHDDYDSDRDIPAVVRTAQDGDRKAKRFLYLTLGGCLAGFGTLAALTLYIVSRFVKVPIPLVYEQGGQLVYEWGGYEGISWKYFVEHFSLELLIVLFSLLILAGVLILLCNTPWGQKLRKRLKAFKKQNND